MPLKTKTIFSAIAILLYLIKLSNKLSLRNCDYFSDSLQHRTPYIDVPNSVADILTHNFAEQRTKVKSFILLFVRMGQTDKMSNYLQ